MKRLILVATCCLTSGCASMVQGSHQNIIITTYNDSFPEKTRCKITNEEGNWNAAPNSPVNIHRDGNAMEIDCNNETQYGEARVESEFNGAFFLGLDLVLDLCIVSCVIDGINNAYYQYPFYIPVQMKPK